MRGRTVAILVALLALLERLGAGAWYFGPLGHSPTVHDAKPVPVPSGRGRHRASGLERRGASRSCRTAAHW